MPSTTSKLNKLNFKPGFHRESTQYSEEGSWYDGDRVRFREGKHENIRGYQKHYDVSFQGIGRDLLTWANNDTQKLLSVGTEKKLYLLYNDYNYDITPITTVVSIGDIEKALGKAKRRVEREKKAKIKEEKLKASVQANPAE